MRDSIYFKFKQGIQASSGRWYQYIQTLGTGGNAVTVLVVSTDGTNKGVPFALKIFRRMSKPERRSNFLEEVAFLEQCDHASIVRVFDKGVFATNEAEYPFVIMEYLPMTLAQVISRQAATTVEKLCYGSQLLSAINYLSQLKPQVVHRDIKPHNIFVKGHACVLGDFGLMKLLTNSDTDDRTLVMESYGVGMPYFYRTPDLVFYAKSEKPLTPKSDVFQLGLTLVELFTGRNPEIRAAEFLAPVELEDIGNIPGELSGAIYKLLSRMLRMNPDERETPAQLMDGWQGIFLDACSRSLALEGRAL